MPSLSPSQAAPLLSSFTAFLTIAIHSLLFHRALYPPPSFLTTRAYSLPVHQSRHPLVCAWIQDAVAALSAQLSAGAVSRVAFVIHATDHSVLERWVFDVGDFPAWGPHQNDPGESVEQDATEEGQDKVNWDDVHEELRAALCRIAQAGESMPPLPADCTFTLAMELRDEAEAPIGHPQSWIPSQAGKARANTTANTISDRATTPIRAVRAGPLFFECWVEKSEPQPSHVSQTTDERP